MADLARAGFTPLHDEIISPIVLSLYEGWSLAAGRILNALTGDDTIGGGLVNNGTILTSYGNDLISAPGYRGVVNYSTGVINTGSGSDSISITRVSDINTDLKNYGLINLQAGNDKILITGSGTPGVGPLSGLENYTTGQIFTGNGSDVITVNGRGSRIRNAGLLDTGRDDDTISSDQFMENPGQILTGLGHDVIRVTTPISVSTYSIFNEGSIQTDSGNDTLTGSNSDIGFFPLFTSGIANAGMIFLGTGNDRIAGVGGNIGIRNFGTIHAGEGHDIITGQGATTGIENWGTILTGLGDDTVNALTGGFAGLGILDLGSGNDVLRGFGTGTFDGGLGIDILDFQPGNYTITASGGGAYRISKGGLQMTVSRFERFAAGADVPLFSQAVLAGQVTFS
ncbi:MAG: hypothetical protein VKP70_00020 [Cyanobacteriota bacterium]|nr:hypothetical protein [Cyanobacteriota bacterium]